VSKRLSFIVFGVPRSGTKGLARGLNLHPNVLCALERFDHRADHSELSFPDSFLGAPRLMDSLQRRKLGRLRAEAAEKPDVVHAGNKFPRYYLALDRINRELPDLRNVLIWRSPYGFMQSWNRKEAERGRGRWHAGQVGLFGFLELLVCLQNAVRQNRVFVFPYELGLNESTEPIEAAIEFVGADPGRFDRDTFVKQHLPRKVESSHRPPLQPHELEFLDRVRARDLDEILTRGWGVVTPGLVRELDEYMTALAPVLPGAVDDAAAGYGSPAVLSYAARYTAANRKELAGLLEMTEGSEFMAEARRFGIGRKLRYVYLQRSFLRRRLTSLRMT
jgi:hypothetical protein